MKKIRLVREAALATINGFERFAVQAARRVVRLQERRRRLRRELRSIDDELKMARAQMRAALRERATDGELDTPIAPAVNE